MLSLWSGRFIISILLETDNFEARLYKIHVYKIYMRMNHRKRFRLPKSLKRYKKNVYVTKLILYKLYQNDNQF